jgi:hypothetical protein
MQTKTNVLVFSLAAILALSVVAMGEIPQAEADKDNKKLKFKKKPDFVSESCFVTSHATNNLPQASFDVLDCKMQAWLDKKANGLKYEIQITGMEWINSNSNDLDDIDGSHIHKMTGGTAINPSGPHVLDAFGNPGFGDSDVVVKPVQGTIEGIWNDGDHPDDLTDNLKSLCEGKIFSAVHGDYIDFDTHHAGYLKMVLEPTNQGEKACDKLGF